jgi:hemerythrin
MPLIDWSDDFETGIGSLDFEHREMIALLNQLAENISSESSRGEVLDFLGEVYAKISAHFALEERVMREHRYAGYQAHKDDHERLLDELREIMELNETAPEAAVRETLSEQLGSWFMVHFHEQDARLHGLMG